MDVAYEGRPTLDSSLEQQGRTGKGKGKRLTTGKTRPVLAL